MVSITERFDADASSTAGAGILGVIGLGAMGEPMARRLLAARGGLVVHGRRRHAGLIDAGAVWAATPADLVRRVEAVLVMLPDLPELEAMLDGPDGLLVGDRDLLLMVGSTSSPSGVCALAQRLHETSGGRVRVVDCPMSGGVDGAIAGTLSIMLGGDPAVARSAARLLSPCGKVVHVGPLGAGQVAKACNQLVVGATILALGEAIVLAERSGIEPRTLLDLLDGGYAGSNLLTSRKEKLVTREDEPSGAAKYMVKDLRFVSDIAEATETSAVLLPAVRAAFEELLAAGLGDRDIAVTRRFIEGRRDASRAVVADAGNA